MPLGQYRGLGLAFDAALLGVDVATVLGASDRAAPEVADWIDAARATLVALDAKPMLERLDAATATSAPARSPGAARPGTREARPVA